MSWFIGCLKKYAVFSGRARRKEYWMFILFALIIMAIAIILDNILGTKFSMPAAAYGAYGTMEAPYGICYAIVAVALLLPQLAVAVRRLHDTGRSGGWWFINLVPFVGSIIFLVFMVLDSQPGANRFGPNPKEQPSAVNASPEQ